MWVWIATQMNLWYHSVRKKRAVSLTWWWSPWGDDWFVTCASLANCCCWWRSLSCLRPFDRNADCARKHSNGSKLCQIPHPSCSWLSKDLRKTFFCLSLTLLDWLVFRGNCYLYCALRDCQHTRWISESYLRPFFPSKKAKCRANTFHSPRKGSALGSIFAFLRNS